MVIRPYAYYHVFSMGKRCEAWQELPVDDFRQRKLYNCGKKAPTPYTLGYPDPWLFTT